MSISRLTRELRDLNPDTRIKAAMNLGEMVAAETLPTLLSVFKKEDNENVRSVIDQYPCFPWQNREAPWQ